MRGFDDAWLRSHQSKMQSIREPVGPIQFTLARPFKLPNETLNMHWAAQRKYSAKLSAEIAGLTAHRIGMAPYTKAAVDIERHSVKEPDPDNLYGGVKQLVDCLLVRSETHPRGLGFIADDTSDCLKIIVRHVKAPTMKAQCTVVRIEGLT